MDIAKKIIKYIGITQPSLDKLASYRVKLASELEKAQRMGLCSPSDAEKLYKQAADDPSSIFSILTFPAVNRSIGTLTNTLTKNYDPIGNWMNS